MCDRWRESFDSFFEDLGPRPSLEHSLDRYPDGKGNYEPANVRWATKREQSRNLSSNVNLTFKGETKCIAEWAEVTGISAAAIYQRIRAGNWSVEETLTTPSARKGDLTRKEIGDLKDPQKPYNRSDKRGNARNLTYKGKTRGICAWARITGINRGTLHTRLKNGWTVEEAFETAPGKMKPR